MHHSDFCLLFPLSTGPLLPENLASASHSVASALAWTAHGLVNKPAYFSNPTETTLTSIRRRVEFKLACIVHKSLAEQTSTYLTSDIQLTTDTGRLQLQSAFERISLVPHTHNSFCDRSFFAAGPHVECLNIISSAGHELQTFQDSTEGTYV